MRLVANIGGGRAFDILKGFKSKALDVLSDQVSIFGARSALEAGPFNLKRVLLGSAANALLAGGDADRHRRNRLQTRAVSIALTQALANAEIRQTRLPPSQSVLLTQCGAIIGNCSLTTGGLGTAPQSQLGFVQTTENDTELAMVSQWFETEWNAADPKGMAVEGLVSSITAAAADHSPGAVYIQALHQLFAEMQVGTDESRIVDSATGIRETQVWSKLYRFQKDGVIGAIDKLQRFGGCIIADSVGLGKTFEALAVIKYFELRNARVLVLAPKRLRENWTLWRRNDVRNILATDRFAFDVLNHTDLSRESGLSDDIDLGHINWANYDLVVIDESHNFRNRPAGKGERESRYDRLLNAVVKAGVKTRVLMLSATPVNNRLNDLKNQIAFATEAHDQALAGHGIASIAGTIRVAQGQFNRWQQLPEGRRTPAKLLEMLGFDYFRLLDLLTIARSRKHIERYYGIAETGTFPEKLAPTNIKSDVDLTGHFPPIIQINNEIRRLKLAAFAPLRYVLESRRAAYERRYNRDVEGAGGGASVFRQLDREESLIALLRVNLLKRMESSVHAFALTIGRQLEIVDALILLCEGWATGATAHEATGLPVIAAMDAGNLLRVAPLIHDRFPGATLVILADNDLKPGRDTNPGVNAAMTAARATNALIAIPSIPGDFNDLAAASGIDAVRQEIWAATPPPKLSPTYPLPTLDLMTVRGRLDDQMAEFMADVAAYWGHDQLDADLVPRVTARALRTPSPRPLRSGWAGASRSAPAARRASLASTRMTTASPLP